MNGVPSGATEEVAMTSIRSRIEVAAAAIAFVAVGVFIPVASHSYFNPTPAAHVAPASVHLLPIVTTHPIVIKTVDPNTVLV